MTIFIYTLFMCLLLYAFYLGVDVTIQAVREKDFVALLFGTVYSFAVGIFLYVYGSFFIYYIFS